ncbi:MAG: tetratricopeptide repeat protein [Terriglobia bacterium]
MKPFGRQLALAALLTLGAAPLALAQVPTATPPAPAEQQVRDEARTQAYYHYSLGQLYEALAGVSHRRDYLTRAIEEFKKALYYDPDSPYLTVRLAEAYHRSGRIRQAVLEAEELLKTDPDNLPARRLLARIYVQTLGELPRSQTDQSTKRTLELAIEQHEAIVRLAPHDIESRLLLARLYSLNNQWDQAEATLKEVLAAEPRSEQALTALAQLYTDQGDYTRAIALLKEVTAAEPSSELLAALAYAYEQAQDPDNASAIYQRARDLDPNNAELRGRLAQSLLNAARYDEAIAEFQALTRLRPNDFNAHLRLAQLYRRRGQFDQATAYLARAQEIAPDNPEVAFNRALLYEAEGKFSQAVEVLSDLVASITRAGGTYNPSERRTRLILLEQLALLHRRLENFDAAVETFELVLELGEENATRAYSQIIETLRQARDLDAAIQRAREVRTRFPDVTLFALQLATLLGDRGRLGEAVALARSLLGGQPEDREVHLALAQIYERNKRYADAEQAMDAADELSREPSEREYVHFLRGAIYERQKKYDLAEGEFRKVLETNPRHALTLNYLGYMLADRGVELEESVELVKRALALDPYNGAYLDSLGWAYYRLGKLDLAEDYLRKAVARTRRDPTIHDHLGDLYEHTGRLELAQIHWERARAEWKRVPKTEFDPDAFAKLEAKLRALRARRANPTQR